MAEILGQRSPRALGRRTALGACLAAVIAAGGLGARRASAQTTPSVVPPVPAVTDTVPRTRVDTTPRAPRGPRPRPAAARRSGLLPPVSPGRAFLSSLVVPGLGQSRLQRPTAGAVFVGLEFGIITMLVKSNHDLRAVQSFFADSVVSSYAVDSLGNPVVRQPKQAGPLNGDLLRARRLHREDWVAALIFNHLISGAEAFVSANLYDLPAQISAAPTPRGTLVALSVTW